MPEALRYSAFLEAVLYDPERGFYEGAGRAGRREGAFLTSPEVGPLFGAVLARALERWWDEMGRPDPFLVEDHGAGPATLFRSVLAAGPACATALRLVAVERSAHQRGLHPAHLPHIGELDGPDARWTRAGGGPLVASAADPPSGAAHIVMANELLDNLPFDLLVRTEQGWREVRVAGLSSGRPEEVLVEASAEDASWAEEVAPDAPVGGRIPRQTAAVDWLTGTRRRVVPGGRIVVFDYASDSTAALARRPWTEWVRTYRDHQRGAAPTEDPGRQDVTVEVAIDQLVAGVGPPLHDRRQADALRAWGLETLVEEGRARWEQRTGPVDLAALTARSRLTEAPALTDPLGMGAHRVLEWRRD